MFEVITFGGGESYRDIFIGVALMTGTGGMASLVRLGLMLGLLLGILRMIGDLNPGRVVKWFIVAAIIYGGLFLPKVTVKITDRYNPALPGATIANVPLGVAFAEATASQIGARVIDMTETAFGSPTDVQYSQTGMIYGAKFMESATRLQFQDQVFTQNLDAFFKNCVWYDLQDNQYTADELAKADDLWAFFASHPPNPARSSPYVTGSGVAAVQIKTCPDIYSSLAAAVDNQTQASAKAMERRNRPGLPDASLLPAALSEMGTLVGLTNAASTDALRSLAQVATLNQLKASLNGSSSESGASNALAQAQAQLQTHNTGNLLGKVGEGAIVVLKIVVDALFIGMFPVLFPCFLLPSIGVRMLQGYLTGFFYLQLWGPMYVIVHQIMMSASYAQTEAAAMLPGVSNGFNLQTLDGINSVNANIQTVAGMMVLMIPVLAAALTKGAMAVGGQGEALLQPFRSGAEAAAGAQTTGNLSYANTSVDTHAFNNVTGNRIQSSSYIDQGFITSRNPRGDEYTTDRSGALLGVRAAPADAAVNIERLHERSAAAGERARIATERSNTLDHVAATAVADTSQRIHEAAWSRTSGSESRTGVSNEARDSDSTGASYVTQLRDEAMRRYGVGFDFAARATEQATIGTQQAFGVSGGIGLGRGGYGANLSHNMSATQAESRFAQRQNDAKEDAALAWIRQQTQASEFRKNLDRTNTEALNKSYATYRGTSQSVSDKTASIWSSTKSFTDSARQAKSDAASLEHSAEVSTRTAEVLRGVHNAAFLQFAGDYLRTTPDKFTRSDGEIANILQGRTGEDRELLYEAADAFAARHLDPIGEPGLIGESRNTLGEPRAAAELGVVQTPDRSPSASAGPRSERRPAAAAFSEEATIDGAKRLGIGAPSSNRELSPDPELGAVQSALGDEVTSQLSKEVKKIPKR
ncbi:conjugal transfer protein TraG N-terminal domain-containing protein [uncultured Phenylobacterium sp.]|uniref:conjugal transfer protein TraG N-terminal domain-containing protein n=1 Tax=uncultured Phenylobacterium sp. TaxID=349273 RepID=UPI0025FFBA68|nr:conjugal transfer protein TraG N-terminal domain-containing protein [uncultured Phenylobacterium sp.]